MYGRAYETYTADELYFQYLNRRPVTLPEITQNSNLRPTQTSPILRMVDGERQFDFMRWQLVPRWEPEFKTKLTTINAKSETVFESRLFRNIVVRQRCIVPLSGFYEWKKEDGAKRPYRIHLQDNSIMNVAGIWDTWRSGTPEARHSFSILTTSANKFMSEIHERMPVILSKEQIEDWLSPEIHEPETLKQMLQPCSNDWLACAVVTEKL